MRLISESSTLALCAILITSAQVYAADGKPQYLVKEVTSMEDPIAYWTPERMRDAKPFPLPEIDKAKIKQIEEGKLPQGESLSADGVPPTDEVVLDQQPLFTPINKEISNSVNVLAKNFHNRGTLNEHFSSSRLVPVSADLTYPYRSVGKLFFTVPGSGNFVCSASALRHRVVLTAGHCVHRGSGGVGGFYTNFLFVPAYRDGAAPLLTWNWTYVAVTGTWAGGGGGVPNAADYAMFEVADKVVNNVVRRLYNYTGYLGYQTLSLLPNHVHQLGYPCNLDDCQKMHQVAAQSARAVAPNNVEYGSDMRGGASGGPWVQNFGVLALGQVGGLNPGLNRVVGVTSYGYVSTDPKALGSSVPDSRFTGLLSLVCGHKAGNCS